MTSFANENINPNLGYLINPTSTHGDPQTLCNSSRDGAQRRRYDTYHLHVDIQPEYQPLKKRNKTFHLSHEQKEQRRNNGERHLDLWTDGSMYPKDPFTNAAPSFSNVTNLLHFTGDGRQGLLGYAQHLEAKAMVAEQQRDLIQKESNELKKQNGWYAEKLMATRETIEDLEKKIDTLRKKETALGPRKRKQKLSNIEKMKAGSGGMKKRVQAVRYNTLLFHIYYGCLTILFERSH